MSLIDTTSVEYSPTHTTGIEDVGDVNIPEIGLNCADANVTQSSSAKKNKKSKPTSFQESLLEAIKNPPFLNVPPETEDPDKAFLMSFLPDIKKLNEENKLELKFQFLQSLKKISESNNKRYNQNLPSNFYSGLNVQQIPPQPQTSVVHQPYYPYSSFSDLSTNSYLSSDNVTVTPEHHAAKNPASLYHQYSSNSDVSTTSTNIFHPLNTLPPKFKEYSLSNLPNQHNISDK